MTGPRGPHQGCYYNDSDPFVWAWLKNLIAAGLIPAGDVDDRPIQEVSPDDVRRYSQAHFFAGIGGWAYALQLAGWGDRPVWTGSCPCQPFSAAGARKSHADERHLWPAWFHLIRECRPITVFGEQVSGAAGLGWLDAVALDLETADYAVGACVLGAHSVGAPHRRPRLWFVGDADGARLAQQRTQRGQLPGPPFTGQGKTSQRAGTPTRTVAHANGGQPSNGDVQRSGEHGQQPQDGGAGSGAVGVSDSAGPFARRAAAASHGYGRSALTAGWDAIEWLPCRDGKARPVEPGTFPLAHGIPGRVGRLRAYGNAIVPHVAAAFVSAYLECRS